MSVRKRTMSGLATFAVLGGMLLLSVSQADASLTQFSFSTSFGSFTDAEAIAVDESTGDVYVYNEEQGTIEKFDAVGVPVNFSALAGNAIEGVGGREKNESELAVDNSSGPASGDIYVANGFGVLIYGSDGKKLGELTQESETPWGEPCGVAVDRSGHVYVGLYSSQVNKYTPSANPVTNADYTASLGGVEQVCNIAAGAEESVYVDSWKGGAGGPVTRYAASQFGTEGAEGAEGTRIVAEGGGTLAVANSLSGELFVDLRNEIVQYDGSGNVLSSFGKFNESLGVAVNAIDGKLYVSNPASKTVEIWQGTVTPSVLTGKATNLSAAGSVTLNAEVDPGGVPIGTCAFQYGTTTSYGSIAFCDQETPLSGNSVLAVSAGISGILLNNVYHYRVAAVSESGTGFGSDRTFAVLVLPTVEDQSPTASSITRASAQLTGTINPEQGDTSYHFEIGTTESYGHNTPVARTGSGISSDTEVSQQVGELLPDTIYHYRLIASNLAGRVLGSDHTFTTGTATLPIAVTGSASSVAENSAVVSGAVDTSGLPTTYGFEIGTSANYGPPTGLGMVGAGLSGTAVSLSLTGLQPGTTYHYRLTATNVDGTSYGIDETFATGAFVNTFATPPAPLPFVSVPPTVFPSEPKVAVKKTNKKKQKKAKKKLKKRGKTKTKAKSKKKR